MDWHVEKKLGKESMMFLLKNHPMKEGCSWRKKLSATPHKRRMEPRSNFEDLITFIKSSHREHTALIDERLESAFTRLNEKLDSISSFTRDLDLRVANIASSIKREEGMLPGKVEINPRRAAVAAITLRNGKGYEPPAYPDQEEAKPPIKKKPMEYVIIGDGLNHLRKSMSE
ncbi:unnamed protein product [Microthlaspi erraticum]|uniref:Uncharacterized protein n=1 Tax=Microthlaspi erraticum TaxID=1685480 RepID=A0A6D2JHE1_9BRAS|nr:unnamed protein product [Microthlaspi erraticum]